MLGDQIGEGSGQITGRRVLPSDDGKPVFEISFSASGRLLGHDTQDFGTYVAVVGADGLVRGEGQGVVMTADGQAGTWKGAGVGQMDPEKGAIHYSGAIHWTTASEGLAALNGITGVFEFDVALADDTTTTKVWEWK